MKNKEKEKNTNPYHKEYGVFSNSIHALKSMLNYSHRFIPVIIISIICAPIMQYLWSLSLIHIFLSCIYSLKLFGIL